MEAKTGKISTIVNQEWAIKDASNRARRSNSSPASAGSTKTSSTDDGHIRTARTGMVLDYALARSNNGYFQRVGSTSDQKMIEYAKTLGLGEHTGINAEAKPRQASVSATTTPVSIRTATILKSRRCSSLFLFQPLSNGGKKVVPQIARAASQEHPHSRRRSRAGQSAARTIEGVLPGMIGAAEYGTAHRGVDASMGVAGKTGSCIPKAPGSDCSHRLLRSKIRNTRSSSSPAASANAANMRRPLPEAFTKLFAAISAAIPN